MVFHQMKKRSLRKKSKAANNYYSLEPPEDQSYCPVCWTDDAGQWDECEFCQFAIHVACFEDDRHICQVVQ